MYKPFWSLFAVIRHCIKSLYASVRCIDGGTIEIIADSLQQCQPNKTKVKSEGSAPTWGKRTDG